jgi:hypothetical protein
VAAPVFPFFDLVSTAGPSAAELLIKTCSEIVSELMRAHEEGRDVSLNAVRTKVAKKNKLKKSPRLVDIIAAVPEGPMKEKLLPKLKAKPIRTASGVRRSPVSNLSLQLNPMFQTDRNRRSHVEAASLSTHRRHRKHLRVRYNKDVCSSP